MVQPLGVAAANTRSTNGRGVIRPFSQTGVVDSRTSSWPTKSMPRSLIALLSRSRSAGDNSPASTGPLPGKPGTAAAIGAFDGEIVEPRQHFLARRFLAAPPGRDVRHLQIFAEQAPAEARQEAQQRPRLQHAGARHVGDHDAVLAQHVDQAGHAEMRGRVEFERIEEIGIDPAQQHVEPLQAGDGADMDAVAADGEVVALDQQEAEIARERRVLEIGFAEGARRQQADARLVAVGAGAQRVAERLEERRHALDIHRLVEIGKGARQHQAIFQRVAGARRRLRAVARAPTSGHRGRGRHRRHRDAGSARPAASCRTPRADIRCCRQSRRPAPRRRRPAGPRHRGRAAPVSSNCGALGDARGQLLPVGLVDDAAADG